MEEEYIITTLAEFISILHTVYKTYVADCEYSIDFYKQKPNRLSVGAHYVIYINSADRTVPLRSKMYRRLYVNKDLLTSIMEKIHSTERYSIPIEKLLSHLSRDYKLDSLLRNEKNTI